MPSCLVCQLPSHNVYNMICITTKKGLLRNALNPFSYLALGTAAWQRNRSKIVQMSKCNVDNGKTNLDRTLHIGTKTGKRVSPVFPTFSCRGKQIPISTPNPNRISSATQIVFPLQLKLYFRSRNPMSVVAKLCQIVGWPLSLVLATLPLN